MIVYKDALLHSEVYGDWVYGDVTIPRGSYELWPDAELDEVNLVRAVVPDSVPIVTPAQGKLALFEAGLLDTVDGLIEAHPYRPLKIWYGSANSWEPYNPYVRALGAELGLTDEQIDALFIAASLK